MNKTALIVTLFFLLIACSSKEEKMTLTGNVKGLKKGTLLLQKVEDTLLITVDSVLIHGNSNFQFSETISSPEMYYLHLKVKDGFLQNDRIAFFAEPKQITINTTLDNFGINPTIKGSANQDKYKEYNKIMERYINSNLSLIEKSLKARQKGNDSLALAHENSQKSVLSKRYFATINFALNNSDYEIAPYLMINKINNSRVKYLDTVYKALNPKIKDSKYGKALESLINFRKQKQ